mgnify:FL=1|tara:strand:- start:231 stop:443 length:213 start_codon:yes stop_codon:yes gene_type:complete
MTNRKYIKLKSVGTAIDIDTFKTYAINVDNTIDYNSCVYLDDCCVDWWCSLSNKDKKTISLITSNNYGGK